MKNILPLLIICCFIIGGILYLKKDIVEVVPVNEVAVSDETTSPSIRSQVDNFILEDKYDYGAFTSFLEAIEFSDDQSLMNVRESLLLFMCDISKKDFDKFYKHEVLFNIGVRKKQFEEIMSICIDCNLRPHLKYLRHCSWVLDGKSASTEVSEILKREFDSAVFERFLKKLNYTFSLYSPTVSEPMKIIDIKYDLRQELNDFKEKAEEFNDSYVFYKRENFILKPNVRYGTDKDKILNRNHYLQYQYYLDLGDRTIGSKNNYKWP
jgi:hypothetical protein